MVPSIKNKYGQALIESLVACTLAVIVIHLLTLSFSQGLIYFIARYQLSEALICLEESSIQLCEAELKQNLKQGFMAKTKSKVFLRRGQSRHQGQVFIQYPKLSLSMSWTFPRELR